MAFDEEVALVSPFPGRVKERVRQVLERPGTAGLGWERKVLADVGAREKDVRELSDADLAAVADALRPASAETGSGRSSGKRGFGAEDSARLCAVGREAARRALAERPYDVQLLGALGMLSGHVVEMATGEGKTLSGALAAAGFALRGRSVHVVSVNDYLARRDAEWMAPVYELLGVSVGWIDQGSTWAERLKAYEADVTYASVSEIGFDVLRDRLRSDQADVVQPAPDVAIVDEADSVLVDEARVPLVLAGATAEGAADPAMAALVRRLLPGRHYEMDEEGRGVSLTSAGASAVETALTGPDEEVDLYAGGSEDTLASVNVALHAHALLRRDVDYLVRDGRVQLINESRGRVARLQRWPDGLQAAVEAKEGLAPRETGEVLDTTTVQALLCRYPTTCGMSGTAVAVAEQLREFYSLEVGVAPRNVSCERVDEPDRVYATVADKEKALIDEVGEANAAGRPVLLGTLDVAESERLAGSLHSAGLTCVVLNAKNDAEEASIVAEAGTYGAITVSTQMAGRGTDIRLGGRDESDHERVARLGGLYVIGSGRFESSRLDDQLRGRAGRQGDPGGSVFFVSLDDHLVTTHAPEAKFPAPVGRGERLTGDRAGSLVDHAQRVAEGVNLQIHRNTWRYNQLIEQQRELVLDYRDQVLCGDRGAGELAERCSQRYETVKETAGEDATRDAARQIVLHHLDRSWAGHLAFLDDLREGIHLRALGRRDPLDEFHAEAVPVFKRLFADALRAAADTFEEAPVTADGVDLEDAGLRRPNATWTYVVRDNPFGTEIERGLKGVARLFGRT